MEVLIPLAAVAVLAGILEIDFHRQRRALGLSRRFRRCPERFSGASWLMTEAHQLDCPRCGRLLANHRP